MGKGYSESGERKAAGEMYYIQDTRSVVGNCVSWWAPNGNGYVCNLNEAGLYTKERAERQHRSRPTDKPVPASLARSLAVSHVRIEHLNDALRKAASDE